MENNSTLQVIEKSASKLDFSPTPAQAAAIAHSGSDLLISAGAGSGKTATLTDRIVNRIVEKGMDISRMLVVTFTRDAANELKVRIAAKLSKKLKTHTASAHLSSQIVKLNSADISTIHSFCLKCIRPHFDKLGLDSDFRIGEESELSILSLNAMNRVIDRFYEEDTLDPDFLLVSDCYSEYTNEDALSQELLSLYKKLCSTSSGVEVLTETKDTSKEFLETPFGQVLLDKVKMIVKHYLAPVTALYDEICSCEDNAKYFDTFKELFDILVRLENALSNPSYERIKAILNSFTNARIKGGKRKLAPTVDVDYLGYIRTDLVNEIKELRDEYFYADTDTIRSTFIQNKKICHALYKVLKEYEAEYDREKRLSSLCDFNDLERYTLKLFYNEDGSLSEIAKGVALQYDELYIDEYQDVNSVQDKIFSAIARNNRFMVGDIKQSIYGFRSAEPELFSGYRDSFVPYGSECIEPCQGKTIFMSDNFRCDPCIIDASNHVSDYMFLNSKGFNYVTEDRLKHSKIHPSDFEPQKAELCLIDRSSVSDDSFLNEVDSQAEFVAQEITRLLDNGRLPNGEKIEPRHIAILLRKTSGKIDRYIDALNRYGIKNEYKEEVSFFEKPHVLLLLSLLNSVDNPSKDVYLAGALHSHVWNFSLDELVKIKRHSPKEYSLYNAMKAYSGENELEKKVEDIIRTLEAYSRDVRKMSAEEALSYIMNETGYLSACDAEERRDAIKLYNIARGYEQGSYKGLYSFLRYIDDVCSKKGIEETVSSDPDNSVKILTMHKSKGLEYEVCFLCDTESSYSARSYTSPLLFHRELGICGYVSRDGGVVKYDNILRKCASLAIRRSEAEEAMRILYVAMTRARSKLYITASLLKQNEKRAKHARLNELCDEYTLYSCNSHIDILLGAFSSPVDFLDLRIITENDIYEHKHELSPMAEESVANTEELDAILRKRLDFKYSYSHLEKVPSKLSISTLYPNILDDDENSEHQKRYTIEALPKFVQEDEAITGADRGTATHVFLQFCDFAALKEKGFDAELKRLLDNTYITPSVGKIINKEHIEGFISSEIIDEFLKAKRIIREFRFNIMLPAQEFSTDEKLENESILVQGVTDCIYENEKGELILVDYKTDRVSEDNYISELKRRHTTQLTYYKKACELMFERPLSKVLIYSVPLAKTVEIE